jgi:ABC-type sugar transport system ATPase subunit
VTGVTTVLEARRLRKTFPGVVALSDGTLTLRGGEVHALLGENGAGKSTLMKILAGIHRPDEGQLLLDGAPLAFDRPRQAIDRGITVIHQEFSLVPDLSIAENLFLGDEPGGALPDFAEMRGRARGLLERLGLAVEPRTLVRDLSVAEQQLVEIARALRRTTRVLAMDEPTAALSPRECGRLFDIVKALRADGIAILYVSHRLAEVFLLCDVATVLRDGATVGHLPLAGVSEDELVKMMVGREVKDLYPRGSRTRGKVVLEARGLAAGRRYRGIDLEVHAGEIVGIAGLVGAGRTEVLRGIFGADRREAGVVRVDGATVPAGDPAAAVAAGIGLLTEDRKQQGLAPGRSIRENMSLATLGRFSPFGLVRDGAEADAVRAVATRLRVRMPGLEADAASLSGGNQQKVLLGRWLLRGCKVLLCDEPTRGIDVGARAEIYEQLHALAAEGLAILVVSSDLPEVLGLCDRILVMAGGALTGSLARDEASEEAVLHLATPRGSAHA